MAPQSASKRTPVHITVDHDRHILNVVFRDDVRAADISPQVQRVAEVVPSLGTGFTMITDLEELKSMDIDCVPHVTRIMDLCMAGGIGRVARVIPDPDKDIGFNLLSLTHYRGKVPTATYESRDALRVGEGLTPAASRRTKA